MGGRQEALNHPLWQIKKTVHDEYNIVKQTSVKQTNSLMWSQKGQRLFVHLCKKHFKVSLVITAGWFSMYSDIQFLVSGLLELRKTRKVCSSAVTGCAVKSNWCTHRFISIDQNNNTKQANRTLWYVHSERDKSETVKQSFTVKVAFSSPTNCWKSPAGALQSSGLCSSQSNPTPLVHVLSPNKGFTISSSKRII